jgi:hypothetical protein
MHGWSGLFMPRFIGMRYYKLGISLALILMFSWTLSPITPPIVADEAPFWQAYDDLLKKGTQQQTYYGIDTVLVDYDLWRDNPLYLNQITKLELFNPETLESKEEKLAYWINVYNIAAIKLVLDKSIKNSVKERSTFLSTVWNIPIISIYGKIYSLGEIEHDILRELDEPRIHFAIVCASLSCPDLRNEAYTASRIYSQLKDQELEFLSNPTKGMKVVQNRETVLISEIFKWFKSDFGGRDGVQALLKRHSKNDISMKQIGYLTYNWKLNKVPAE